MSCLASRQPLEEGAFPRFHGKGRGRVTETVGTECISKPPQESWLWGGSEIETQVLLEMGKASPGHFWCPNSTVYMENGRFPVSAACVAGFPLLVVTLLASEGCRSAAGTRCGTWLRVVLSSGQLWVASAITVVFLFCIFSPSWFKMSAILSYVSVNFIKSWPYHGNSINESTSKQNEYHSHS